jgi:LuxR family transcriptional regulator, maltose regulon positive regulatory protein
MQIPILATKLFVPELKSKFVERKHLMEKLILGLDSKLTLVSAPAGYGKTSIVLEFLNNIQISQAWISLDESDNDIIQFLIYLMEALKMAGVDIGEDTLSVASDMNLSSTQTPMTYIINDIVRFKEKVILVLDDYHLINSPHINQLIKYLLEHQPSNLHLILITREDPSFPLANLRAQRKINEIRMKDLYFTTIETKELLYKGMALSLNEDAINSLTNRTEGWVVGLQLAGLALLSCHEEERDDFIKEFNDNHLYIIDYLVEEVINRQPQEIREFLCKTSILDRMNGELCDFLTSRNDSKDLLSKLISENLFIVILDVKREWFRYHHLFADSLRIELSKTEEQELHLKASLWFKDHGFLQESIKHALRSGMDQLALELIESNTEQAFKSGQLLTLLGWMDALPNELVRKSEILSVRKAWALYLTGNSREAMEHLHNLGNDFYKGTTKHNKGLILSLKALRARQLSLNESEQLASEALEYLEGWDPISRISTLNTLGRSQESLGQTQEAIETFRNAFREGQKLGFTLITTISLTHLGTSLNTTAKRKEAIELYHIYIEGMEQEFHKPLPFIGLVYISLAELYYEGHELQKAKECLEEGVNLCKNISYNWNSNIVLIEAKIRYALGEHEQLFNKLLNELEKAQSNHILGTTINILSLLIELYVKSNKLENASLSAEQLRNLVLDENNFEFYNALLPYIKALVHKQRFEEALILLNQIESELTKSDKLKDLASTYLLYASIYYLKNDHHKSTFYFLKAVEIAQLHEYYQLFLNLDLAVLKNIIMLPYERENLFIVKLKKLLDLGNQDLVSVQSKVIVNGNHYREKLSKRELEILNLIGKGLSNLDIAHTLYISVNTTQWHISNIYSKLNVKNRTQAILIAQELGLL